MRALLLNPPHPCVTSRSGIGRMPPLGLLAVGGPLTDAGHDVRLLDADLGPMSTREIVDTVGTWAPGVLLVGHGGSTSAHPGIVALARALKVSMPRLPIVYGGVYPTYHALEILEKHEDIDVIVRGEGEVTAVRVVDALAAGASLDSIPGIGYREGPRAILTPPARASADLDAFRVGWDLIEDWDRYHYWGVGRAAVVQLSRGCPHPCTYCGQRGFWTKWRTRDPVRLAKEIGWLHRTHDVRFVDLADENPTTSKRMWRTFLEALIAENVPVKLIGTIRATDIVRDADILHLYKQAGFERILMGIETTDEATIERIDKGSSSSSDVRAIRLLREHDILSQVAYVVGFDEETDRDHWRGLRQLVRYDPDLINAMYVTPHRWTPFYTASRHRRVVDTDQSHWDYRHQVLETRVPRWRAFLWVKLTETVLQLRPRALSRVLAHRDIDIRKALRWNYGSGRLAFFYELRNFELRARSPGSKRTLAQFWGAPQEAEERALLAISVRDARLARARP